MNLSNAAFMPMGGPQAHVKLKTPSAASALACCDRAVYCLAQVPDNQFVEPVLTALNPGSIAALYLRSVCVSNGAFEA